MRIRDYINRFKMLQGMRKIAKSLIKKDGTIVGVYVNGEPMKLKGK